MSYKNVFHRIRFVIRVFRENGTWLCVVGVLEAEEQ